MEGAAEFSGLQTACEYPINLTAFWVLCLYVHIAVNEFHSSNLLEFHGFPQSVIVGEKKKVLLFGWDGILP